MAIHQDPVDHHGYAGASNSVKRFAGKLRHREPEPFDRLGVHRKTVAHRPGRISELTGLDLSTHDDRLVADMALYVYRLPHATQGDIRA